MLCLWTLRTKTIIRSISEAEYPTPPPTPGVSGIIAPSAEAVCLERLGSNLLYPCAVS